MKTEEENFMDELLADAELQDEQRTEAYYDLLLLQIQQLQDQIAYNFGEAEKEVKIINHWALNKNHALQVKIEWMEKKLEAFIREHQSKTIDLPHGVIKLHKKQDKVEITDMELFLKHAPSEVMMVIPEQVKPDLTMLKRFLKSCYKPLPGTVIISGKEEFSYKLNNRKEDEDGRQEETGVTAQPTLLHRIAL